MYLIFRWTRTVIHRLLVDEVELDEVELVLVLVVAARVDLHLFQDRGGDLGLAHLRTPGATDYHLVRHDSIPSTSHPIPGSADPRIQVSPLQVHTHPH